MWCTATPLGCRPARPAHDTPGCTPSWDQLTAALDTTDRSAVDASARSSAYRTCAGETARTSRSRHRKQQLNTTVAGRAGRRCVSARGHITELRQTDWYVDHRSDLPACVSRMSSARSWSASPWRGMWAGAPRGHRPRAAPDGSHADQCCLLRTACVLFLDSEVTLHQLILARAARRLGCFAEAARVCRQCSLAGPRACWPSTWSSISHCVAGVRRATCSRRALRTSHPSRGISTVRAIPAQDRVLSRAVATTGQWCPIWERGRVRTA